jgi:hypothetical protein
MVGGEKLRHESDTGDRFEPVDEDCLLMLLVRNSTTINPWVESCQKGSANFIRIEKGKHMR